MGKQTNAQVLRFLQNKDWTSKYYSSPFNYSNLIVQDILIREYVINFISRFNTKVAQVYIYRKEHRIIIRIFSYNDSFTNWKSFILKHRNKLQNRKYSLDQLSTKHKNILNPKDLECYDWFKVNNNLSNEIIFVKNQKEFDYLSANHYLSKNNKCIGYSGKRLLSLNLSYLLKTNVTIKNTNIISNGQRVLLLKIFSSMGFRLRSPLSKYLRTKFICLVYYSLLYKSSLLLCRYLRFIIPRFCKKKRKSRKINPFLKSLKSAILLMFFNNFMKDASVKGIKVLFKGRINGSRRKRTYVISQGQTSTQSFKNEISYHQEDCLTIFGILGIKVWIIY
jgi:hypothetical protein